MEALVEWLKSVFGKRWVLILPIVFIFGWIYYDYSDEQKYHGWAGSRVAHYYSDVQYKDGYIRVLWERLPKIPEQDLMIHYLFARPGLPLVGNVQQFLPVHHSNAYRASLQQDETNIHSDSYWGSPIFVGDLNPGEYEMVVYYQYTDNWWYPDWSADQRITFTVK